MAAKQLKELQEKYENVLKENTTLKEQLSQLNESTVISSMNDMKEKYEYLEENSVCIHQFLDLKQYYKESFDTLKTITNINEIIQKRIGFIYNTLKDNEEEFKKIEKYIVDSVGLNCDMITNYSNLIDEIVMCKDLEWESNVECLDCSDFQQDIQ